MSCQNIYKTDGVSDEDRYNTSLIQSSFKMHDLTILELLSCSSHRGSFIKYISNDTRSDGTWSDLFKNDELGIIADIINYSCNNNVSNMSYQLRTSGGFEDTLKSCINNIIETIGTVDNWIKILSGIDRIEARLFLRQINQLIESDFIHHYITFLSIVKNVAENEFNISLPTLYGPWKNVIYKTVDVCNSNELNTKMSNILYAINGVITSIKKYAEMFYRDSLNRSDHSPELSMFITFLKLFERIQAQINTIPEKYALFYYEKILQFSRKGAVSDTVYVTLTCNAKDNVMIPERTEFTAQIEDKTILYESQRVTSVKPVSVESVCSIYLEKNRFKEPEKSLGFYTKIKTFESTATNGHINQYKLSQERNSDDNLSKNSVDIGFAIASKIFLLSEGRRNITCTFTITDDLESIWDNDFKKKILTLSGKEYDKNSWKHEFVKIFKSLFTIELTAEKGWYTVEIYQPNASIIDPKCPHNSIQFEFTIPVHAPPIIMYDKSVHGYSFSSLLPVCKMTFNDNAELFPYSFLKNIMTSDVHIDVSVEGATGLLLYNQYGPLVSSNPFMPFGPIPVKGDNFIIGYHELANKSVQSIDLEIEWGNVPWQKKGFSEIYEGYSYRFNNNSFRVKISELRDGLWVDLDDEEKQSIILYGTEKSSPQSENGIGMVMSYTKINNIKVNNFKEKTLSDDKEDFQYNNKVKSRFIRLTLISPDCGFGQPIFANDLSSSFFSKIHNKNGGRLPTQPYYPVINTLKLNYNAKTNLNFSKSEFNQSQSESIDSFYHIEPFGINKLCPGSGCSNVSLIPLVDEIDNSNNLCGNLFIGLKGNIITGELSLFFKMNENAISHSYKKVSWSILTHNKWVFLDQKSILSDTTCELSSSGIITFNIPKVITSNNTIMQTGLYWIRGAVESNGECFINIQSIHANGIQLIRKKNEKLTYCSFSVPESSIKGLVRQIAGISDVIQQTVSTGGINEETTNAFMTRVSETLRHKNRLVTTKDYEQIILEKFNEIYKVKCFKNVRSSNPEKNDPGNIVICVIPTLKIVDTIEYQCPKVPMHELHAIKTYLKKYASSNITLEVINPIYEQIQIRCSIEPDKTVISGDIINLVNKEISDYISPWNSKGNKCCFGWRIVLAEIRHYISQITDVKRVTNFSVLHITSPELDKYQLTDTAEEYTLGNKQNSIESRIPWSICIPFRQHAIEIVDKNIYGMGQVAGISKMDISKIFIIKGQKYGYTEQKDT